MPFTLAHPAVIIPLYRYCKKYVSLTGLIIGSIVPDVEYCVNIFTRSVISHTLKGVLLFDLPMAFLITICYHAFLKQILLTQLPLFISKYFLPYRHLNWFQYFARNPLPYLFSVTAGIFLHIFWDGFTHPSGYFVRQYDWLNYPVINSFLNVSRLLWHISTWVGLFFCFRFLNQFIEPSTTPTSDKIKNFWPLVYLVASTYLFLLWMPFLRPQELRYVLIAIAGSALFGVTIISLIFRLIFINRP